MQFRAMFVAVFCLVMLVVVGVAEEPTYQTGKIVSVQKRDTGSTGGSDAATKPDQASYNVVIETGGTSYTCRYRTSEDLDPSWAAGKEAPVRVKGKTMYIKRADGAILQLSIVRSKPSAN